MNNSFVRLTQHFYTFGIIKMKKDFTKMFPSYGYASVASNKKEKKNKNTENNKT